MAKNEIRVNLTQIEVFNQASDEIRKSLYASVQRIVDSMQELMEGPNAKWKTSEVDVYRKELKAALIKVINTGKWLNNFTIVINDAVREYQKVAQQNGSSTGTVNTTTSV